ncbi:MAG: PaaI family thioesterase [Bacteroidales bacterium]|nr:PaaI family thioesterase [Candidatus Cryptobacteroides caccocaballi]
MNIDHINEHLQKSQGFEHTLGMQFISTPEPDTCMGRLHVDKRVTQPFGYLSGGAILGLAETLAGVGSIALCPDCKCVGINVNASHVHSAKEGETVTALGHLIHKGGQTHVWRIDVSNEDGRLISTVTVTNFVKPL